MHERLLHPLSLRHTHLAGHRAIIIPALLVAALGLASSGNARAEGETPSPRAQVSPDPTPPTATTHDSGVHGDPSGKDAKGEDNGGRRRVLTLKLSGLAKGSLRKPLAAEGADPLSAYGVLRGGVKLDLREFFLFAVLYEASTDDHKLLDLNAGLHGGWGRIRMGRFKTPVSVDYLVPFGRMTFLERAQLTGLATKRANGAMYTRHFKNSSLKGNVDVGLFGLDTSVDQLTNRPLALARGIVTLPGDWTFHAAFAHPLRAQEDVEGIDPQIADAALSWKNEYWSFHLETIADRYGDQGNAQSALVWASRALNPWGPQRGLSLAAAYEITHTDLAGTADTTQRARAALDTHWWGSLLITRLEYQARIGGERTEQDIGVEIQLKI